ncbi:MAG: helix-turn-helix transcriptional regulator [Oscillospiraceae bacterium]|nr:helix-turn-helix transcriptional regulator [Oscillospiraceae bacterium]
MKRGEAFTRVHNPLQDLRIEHGYSVKDVAEYLGISSATVSKIFNGKQPVTPKIKQGLMEMFELGYGQICDACNRMATFYYSGDIRTRARIQDKPAVEAVDEKSTPEVVKDITTQPINDFNWNSEVFKDASPSVTVVKLEDLTDPTFTRDMDAVRQNPDYTREKILDIVYGKITRQEYIALEQLLNQLN